MRRPLKLKFKWNAKCFGTNFTRLYGCKTSCWLTLTHAGNTLVFGTCIDRVLAGCCLHISIWLRTVVFYDFTSLNAFTCFNICLDNSTRNICPIKNVRVSHSQLLLCDIVTVTVTVTVCVCKSVFRVQNTVQYNPRVKWIQLKTKRYESKLDFIAFVGSFLASS